MNYETANVNLELIHAIKAGTPLLAVETTDPGQVVTSFATVIRDHETEGWSNIPVIAWDFITGLYAPIDFDGNVCPEAERTVSKLRQAMGGDDYTVNDPVHLCKIIRKALPERAIVFAHQLDRWMACEKFKEALWQAIFNLRDDFKMDNRALVSLGGHFQDLPRELRCVYVLNESYPDRDECRAILQDMTSAKGITLDEVTEKGAVNAVIGMNAYDVEQSIALSIREGRLHNDELQAKKRSVIESTQGLSVYYGGEKFGGLGGLLTIKTMVELLRKGPMDIQVVVWLDEIEKSGIMNTSDLSGTNSDQLGQVLTYMEDTEAMGMVFLGPPGGGKTASAKAIGNELGVMTVRIDLGALKGGLVGKSEELIRTALKTITAISNGKALWIATANSIEGMDTALRRRFPDVYFFDTPDAETRASIWEIWKSKYEITDAISFDDSKYMPSDIRDVCRKAWRFGASLDWAAKHHVPVGVNSADEIERLRIQADGKLLSADYEGVYKIPTTNDTKPAEARRPGRRRMA